MLMEQNNKIMIVDDNPIDQLVTAHVLKTNYAQENVLVMGSASAALEYLQANQHQPAVLPSLILLDLDMPQINGFGFLAQFSNFSEEVKKSCKIIVLTASTVQTDVELIQQHPHVLRLISKPLGKNALNFKGTLTPELTPVL